MKDNECWQLRVVNEMQVIWFWPKDGVKKLVEGQSVK